MADEATHTAEKDPSALSDEEVAELRERLGPVAFDSYREESWRRHRANILRVRREAREAAEADGLDTLKVWGDPPSGAPDSWLNPDGAVRSIRPHHDRTGEPIDALTGEPAVERDDEGKLRALVRNIVPRGPRE